MPLFLINTLLLYISLLALTDRQNYRQRVKLILVGLGNLQFLQVNKVSFVCCVILYVLPTEQELIPEY